MGNLQKQHNKVTCSRAIPGTVTHESYHDSSGHRKLLVMEILQKDDLHKPLNPGKAVLQILFQRSN